MIAIKIACHTVGDLFAPILSKKVIIVAMTSFLNINGYDVPCPRYGLEYIIATNVDAGRNLNGAVIGQRVGRDLYKINNLQWTMKDQDAVRRILLAIEPFFIPVTFEDAKTGLPITVMMYPGDRTIKPYYVDPETHVMEKTETLAFNLIDLGW